jgi:two-component system, LytTR family, response regulator
METITALIVDDEVNSRDTLSFLLESLCPEVSVVGQAENAEEAKQLIQRHGPRLVFLDIQMPGQTGLELLVSLEKIDFDIIFTTAYHEYAVKAFRFSAIDYLLKPINPDELTAAVKKVLDKKNLFSSDQLQLLKQALSDFQQPKTQKAVTDRKLAIPVQDGTHFIDLKDIIWCESLGAYTRFHLVDGTKLVISRLIKEYEDILENFDFARIHQSYIINLQHIKKYSKLDGGTVQMSDGAQLEVARRRKDDFQKLLAAYSVNERSR